MNSITDLFKVYYASNTWSALVGTSEMTMKCTACYQDTAKHSVMACRRQYHQETAVLHGWADLMRQREVLSEYAVQTHKDSLPPDETFKIMHTHFLCQRCLDALIAKLTSPDSKE